MTLDAKAYGQYLGARERIRQLSPLERKIVTFLGDVKIATNQEIARNSFTPERNITSALKSLATKGVLESSKLKTTDKRQTTWEIIDEDIKLALAVSSRDKIEIHNNLRLRQSQPTSLEK